MRDKIIDGYRAVAVLGVVFSHAVTYRFGGMAGPWQRFAGPLAEIGVQLFFVISGFIITSLLLREEDKSRTVSIPAFYARRTFRILPPFLLMIAIANVDAWSKIHAGTFTCNIAECGWGVAHSWSLAVEEQYYLAWPLLFVVLGRWRALFLAGTIAALLAIYAARPFTYHANALSFACIATGALLAVRPVLQPSGKWPQWLAAGALLIVGPMLAPLKLMGLLTPFLVAYLLFGARDLPLARSLLESRPMQFVGLCSYSLYLWQQGFLGKGSGWPLWLLPPVVLVSVYLVEKPFNAVGHRLSGALKRSNSSSRSRKIARARGWPLGS